MKENQVQVLPLVPLRDMVVFPHMKAAFVVRSAGLGRRAAARARGDRQADLPGHPARPAAGRAGRRRRLRRRRDRDDPAARHLPNGTIKVGVEGVARGRWKELREREGRAGRPRSSRCCRRGSPTPGSPATCRRSSTCSRQYARLSQQIGVEGVLAELQTEDPELFADTLAAALPIATSEKQELLAAASALDGCSGSTTCSTSRSRRSTSTGASTPRSRSR